MTNEHETSASISAQDSGLTSRERRLRLVFKLTLAFVIAGMVFVGKQRVGWPIITWPMYSGRSFPPPPSTFKALELVVILADGSVHVLTPANFYPAGRSGVPDSIVRGAFAHQASEFRKKCRLALFAMARREVHAHPVSIEAFEITWTTDPTADPPLNRSLPDSRLSIGILSFEEGGRSP